MVALTIFVSVHSSLVYATEIAGVALKFLFLFLFFCFFFMGKIARKFTLSRYFTEK